MSLFLTNQVIMSTAVDRDGDSISEEALRLAHKQMPDPMLLNQQHDMSLPPAGLAHNMRVEKLSDGSLAIVADIEIYDERLLDKYGGFSPALRVFNEDEDHERTADVEIQFDSRFFAADEIRRVADAFGTGVFVVPFERKLKSSEPTPIKVVNFVVDAVLSGLLWEGGKCAYLRVREHISRVLANRAAAGQPGKVQLHSKAGNSEQEFLVIMDMTQKEFDGLGPPHSLASAHDYVGKVIGRTKVQRVAIRPREDPPYWEIIHVTDTEGRALGLDHV